MIRKEVFVSQSVIEEVKRIIADSEVTKEDDKNWPMYTSYSSHSEHVTAE